MKILLFFTIFSIISVPSLGIANSLVPAPLAAVNTNGTFALHDGDLVIYSKGDDKAAWTAQYILDLFAQTHNLHLSKQEQHLQIRQIAQIPAITISRCAISFSNSTEAYDLNIDKTGIHLCAKSDAGLFYSATSLWQLVERDLSVPFTHIQDAPRFGWRGMLLDSARHYQSPEFIKKLINALALHKLNVLHWHLTDDQAWRLEIKRYPRLTSFAAWRVPAGQGPASDIDPATGKPRLYGGFYSQEQVKEIVQYASDRNVMIVPEIEMPGHAMAAIVAYPYLASIANPPTNITHDWGVFPYLYNVGDDSFQFLENVMDEVIALFPGPFIHVGGDEAVKDQWKASQQAQQLMQQLGLADEDALQGWFIQRVGKYLEAHGKRIIGWDEILTNGLESSAAVMSWHGLDSAATAAKSGHDTVITAAPNLYFDGRMNNSAYQPPGVAENIVTLQSVYKFNPVPGNMTTEVQKHLLGLEGAVWTENFRTEEQVARTTFPRELAIAELGWSAAKNERWADFLSRMPREEERLSSLGMEFSDSPFEPMPVESQNSDGKTVQVSLSNQTNFGEFRYTLNGQNPTSNSTLYQQAMNLPVGSVMRVASFSGAKQISDVKERHYDSLSLHTKSSFEMSPCYSEGFNLASEDDAPAIGSRAFFIVDYMHPCWIYNNADLSNPTSIIASVGQLPFNLQIGDDINSIHYNPPSTPDGELEVRLDDCQSDPVAIIPLHTAVNNFALTTLPSTQLPAMDGIHNLCFSFTQSSLDPYWVINKISIVPSLSHPRAVIDIQ